jgi:hypothetical protein
VFQGIPLRKGKVTELKQANSSGVSENQDANKKGFTLF